MAKSKSPTKPKNNGKKPSPKRPKGCYVLSLTVENIRCFGPKQTLLCSDEQSRPKQWTVILGDNGTGKTTLLESLVFSQMSSLRVSGRNITKLSRSHMNEPSIRIALGEGKLFSVSAKITFAELARSANEPSLEEISCVDDPRGRPCFLLAAYDFNREQFALPPGDYTISQSVNKRSDWFRVRHATDWLIHLDYSATRNKSDVQIQRRDQVVRLLIDILEDVEDIKFIEGSGPVPEPSVEFLTSYGWVPIHQLGRGYQSMIAWVTDFVSRMVERYPESENPLAEPAVCLVDEIDLHMHPVWQRKVIGYLSERFPNTQFIVTAHSPLVVQAAASVDANIVVLARSQEKGEDGNYYVEIRNNPEDVRNWRLDQILTSDLFGVGLRSQKIDEQIARKQFLQNLSYREPQEEAELKQLQAQLKSLPIGDSEKFASDIKLLQEAISVLRAEKSS